MANMIDNCVERERLLLDGRLIDCDVTQGWAKTKEVNFIQPPEKCQYCN
jgi:hypothetical protein